LVLVVEGEGLVTNFKDNFLQLIRIGDLGLDIEVVWSECNRVLLGFLVVGTAFGFDFFFESGFGFLDSGACCCLWNTNDIGFGHDTALVIERIDSDGFDCCGGADTDGSTVFCGADSGSCSVGGVVDGGAAGG